MRRCVVLSVAISLATALPPLASAQFNITLPGLVRLTPDEVAPPVGHLLRTPIVRKELNLSKDQVAKLTALQQEEAKKYEKTFAALDKESQDVFDRQVGKVTNPLRTNLREQMNAVLSPAQKQRIEQIELQLMGPGAFAQAKVRKGLKLSEEQARAIDKVLQQADADLKEVARTLLPAWTEAKGSPREVGEKREEIRKRWAAFQKKVLDQLEAGLTAEQQKTWKAMQGPAYPLSTLKFFIHASFRNGPHFRFDPLTVRQSLADELKLSDDEKGRLLGIATGVVRRYEAEVEKLDAKLDDVDARRDQVEQRLQAGLAPKLLAVLEPGQRRRLDQIRLQLLGLHAWEDRGVRKALGLTEAQRTAIGLVLARAHARVPEQAREIIRATEREAGRDLYKRPKLRDEKAAALYQGYANEIHSRLTDAQKKKWQELVGPPVPLEYRLDILASGRDPLGR